MTPCPECGKLLSRGLGGHRNVVHGYKRPPKPAPRCKGCGGEFVRETTSQRYCTPACRPKSKASTAARPQQTREVTASPTATVCRETHQEWLARIDRRPYTEASR